MKSQVFNIIKKWTLTHSLIPDKYYKGLLFRQKMFNHELQKSLAITLLIILIAVSPYFVSITPNAHGQQRFGPPPPGGAPPGGLLTDPFSDTQADASTNETCTLTPSLIEVEGTPQQTEGPYFVDNMPNRSDITSDTTTGSVQEGIPLRLVINVYDVDGDGG
jgi:protocatechuate 3,4-dioxygenase beta subunit